MQQNKSGEASSNLAVFNTDEPPSASDQKPSASVVHSGKNFSVDATQTATGNQKPPVHSKMGQSHTGQNCDRHKATCDTSTLATTTISSVTSSSFSFSSSSNSSSALYVPQNIMTWSSKVLQGSVTTSDCLSRTGMLDGNKKPPSSPIVSYSSGLQKSSSSRTPSKVKEKITAVLCNTAADDAVMKIPKITTPRRTNKNGPRNETPPSSRFLHSPAQRKETANNMRSMTSSVTSKHITPRKSSLRSSKFMEACSVQPAPKNLSICREDEPSGFKKPRNSITSSRLQQKDANPKASLMQFTVSRESSKRNQAGDEGYEVAEEMPVGKKSRIEGKWSEIVIFLGF